MGRRWVPIVIVVVGGVLGLAVAGFPSRRNDAPITVQALASTSTSTSVVKVVTTLTATSVTTAVRSPADLRVTVFNASSIPGSATRVGTVIKARGYDLKAPGADRTAQATSVIMYRSGYDNGALALALGLDPGVVAALDVGVVSPDTTDLGVLVGTDLAKRTD
ncbi:MAG: LytR C-terminal domain-containing protein [Actinomycetota bacterium]|nr:LytR C-terminal domain-containing protein [Actinomycetota bacterium]